MRNVLFIAPTAREFRALPPIAERHGVNLIWDDFAGDYFDDFLRSDASPTTMDIVSLIERTIDAHREDRLVGVTSAVGYPGMSVVAVVAQRLGLPGPSIDAIMRCEHKYYSRLAQRDAVSEFTPDFKLIDPNNEATIDQVRDFPIFLKPVKSCMSMNAFAVSSKNELVQRMHAAMMPKRFTEPFDHMARAYSNLVDLSCNYLLAEELLKGQQVSLEGYVYNGKPVVMGIVDGEVFPGTLSFSRWIYPSRLPATVQQRMEQVAVDFFSHIGYDNAMFNMELFWDEQTDRINIIEVNPKIASQFPDLFEKVDGISSYEILLRIALGQEPEFEKRRGQFKIAGSCVLRTFEDKMVIKKPTAEDVQRVQNVYPDALISVIATEGRKLSEQSQDTVSYRYGLINIGAQSLEELEAKNEVCKSMLPYQFACESARVP
ncbi:MAG TPA: ATP-grasp domain-containing protein [Trichormus sp.]|jgi:biotin carboxylase